MSEEWDTDENYESYVEFAHRNRFLPSSRSDWVRFNRAMDSFGENEVAP